MPGDNLADQQRPGPLCPGHAFADALCADDDQLGGLLRDHSQVHGHGEAGPGLPRLPEHRPDAVCDHLRLRDSGHRRQTLDRRPVGPGEGLRMTHFFSILLM